MEELLNSDKCEPLISVVVPIFNAAEFLGEALNSLRRQSYERFEAILIDDGSTDASRDICERYAESDSRFRIIDENNQGVSAARNKGIVNAVGEWIVFMDADDIYYPDALQSMFSTALKTGAQIVAARYLSDVSVRPPRGDFSVSVLPSDDAIICGLYQKQILNNPWGMLFKTEIFRSEDAPLFRGGRYEDLDFFYRVFERVENVALLNRTVYFYRDNPNSFINTWSERRLDVLDVTDRIVSHYRNRLSSQPSEKSTRLLNAALDRRFSAHYNILLLLFSNNVAYPEIVDRCVKIIKTQRGKELTDSNVRQKNKLGALLSYGGLPAIKLMSKILKNKTNLI